MKKTKRRMKLGIASTCYHSGLLALSNRIKRMLVVNGDACVLMYHRVVDNPFVDHDQTELGLIVSTAVFEKQIAYLSRNYNVIPLQTLAEVLRDGGQLPPRTVAISFDDGWRDNYTHAYPILRKYNVPATIFLTTDFIGTKEVMWFHQVGLILGSGRLSAHQIVDIVRTEVCKGSELLPQWLSDSTKAIEIVSDLSLFLDNLKPFDFLLVRRIIDSLMLGANLSMKDWQNNEWIMTWDDVRAADPQIIQFGSHGQSHQIMTGQKREELEKELVESKNVIEKQLDRSIGLLAYPNGDYNSDVIELTRAAGYMAAFATGGMGRIGGDPNLFAIRRLGIHEGSSMNISGEFSKTLFAFSVSNWSRFPRGSL